MAGEKALEGGSVAIRKVGGSLWLARVYLWRRP